jgi:hypothetical protein
VAAAKSNVLCHVIATAPALVLDALQQDAYGPQSLFAHLVLHEARGSYITPLLNAAAAHELQLRQMVVSLLQYTVDGSSSSTGDKDEAAELAAAAADALLWVLIPYKKQPATDAAAAILAEQPQVELLQQALRQAVRLGSGDDTSIKYLRALAHVLRWLCDVAYAAVQPQLTPLLQELMQLVLEQGNKMAARAVAAFADSRLVMKKELAQYTASLLQAVQPDKPLEVQAAAWQLLEPWARKDAGRAAVLRQNWLHIVNVMVQQGSWLSSGIEAVAAAGSSGALRVQCIYSSKESNAAYIAACIVSVLVDFGFDALESEECVRKLLQAAVPPPALGTDASSSSSSSGSSAGAEATVLEPRSLNSSTGAVPGAPGPDAGSSSSEKGSNTESSQTVQAASCGSSSSRKPTQWSAFIGKTAYEAMDRLINDTEDGFEAAAQHVGLILAAMQQSQDAEIAEKATDFARHIAREGGLEDLCTAEHVATLLALLQQPVNDQYNAGAVLAVAEILRDVGHTAEGLRLLAQQGCYDALVRATQHWNETVALQATELVLRLTAHSVWLNKDSTHAQEAAPEPAEQQQQQQAVNPLPADQLQQQEQQQQPAAAAVASAATLVPQPWHVQLLAQAAQNPILAKPAIMSCVFIADSGNTHALLLAPYRAALMRAVRRLQPLIGIGWAGLTQGAWLEEDDLEPLNQLQEDTVKDLRGLVAHVMYKVQGVLEKVEAQLAQEV